jgi:hypothetical protein|tara:strand:- start:5 stop:232 length:228 start_codon:yes stop_codon:yes gene_type:complete
MQNENNNSKTKIKELIQNYKTVFKSDDGKMVMDDLEKRCFYNTSTYNSKEPNETAFFEGQRTVLLFIKSMINHKE